MFHAVFTLGLKLKVANSAPFSHKPKYGRGNFNLTMYYRSHGPPVKDFGPPAIEPYISDTINSIQKGGQGVYVMISVGMHLLSYGPIVYLHRLKGIRKVINNHHALFPDTKFLIHGLSVRPGDCEWEIRRFDILLRQVFRDMKNVAFVDMWSMTTAHLQTGKRFTKEMVSDQSTLIYSYFCPRNMD